MAEMPILKALRRLIIPQFVKPDWIRWVRDREVGWEVPPDKFMPAHSLAVDFNHSSGSVRVTIDIENGPQVKHHIPWCDPECDTKVVKLIKDWFVMLWKEAFLDVDGFPNPSIGGVQPKS